jgi:hypothetical protein
MIATVTTELRARKISWTSILATAFGPKLVLSALVVVELIGALESAEWVKPVGTTCVLVIWFFAFAVLFAAEPLPRLQDSSHLLGRLAWAGRFFVAAVVLCISSFVGAIAGASILVDKTGMHLNGTGATLRAVLANAGEALILILFAWLLFDLVRFKTSGRREAVSRLFGKLTTPEVADRVLIPFVERWMLALCSPFVTGVAFAAVASNLISTLVPISGLRIG